MDVAYKVVKRVGDVRFSCVADIKFAVRYSQSEPVSGSLGPILVFKEPYSARNFARTIFGYAYTKVGYEVWAVECQLLFEVYKLLDPAVMQASDVVNFWINRNTWPRDDIERWRSGDAPPGSWAAEKVRLVSEVS